ncbi:Rrf2 family transcriptional regulator [Candidatus Gracilibacteria bacterium]|nr:Rrf2 family transcriptional regulator [Candidatus Gracilibacteria bacterium]
MLKLSQTGDDALNALCYIAEHTPQVVQIRDIAQHHGVSESCLRLIIADLAKARIIETKQGRGGGVFLIKKPSQISIYDVLLAVGEELGIVDCTRGTHCERMQNCYSTHILSNLQRGMHSLLKMQTIDKIIKK